MIYGVLQKLNIDITKYTRWHQILTPIVVLLFLMLLILLFPGCEGKQLLVRPDVIVSGVFYPPRYPGYYYPGYYQTFWTKSRITVVNGTAYYLDVVLDGKKLVTRLTPGQEVAVDIPVDYLESRQVSLVAVARTASGRFIGTSSYPLYFYGAADQRRSETWIVSWINSPNNPRIPY